MENVATGELGAGLFSKFACVANLAQLVLTHVIVKTGFAGAFILKAGKTLAFALDAEAGVSTLLHLSAYLWSDVKLYLLWVSNCD